MNRPLVVGVAGAVGLAAVAMLVIVAAGWSPRVEYLVAVSCAVVAGGVALRRLTDTVAPPTWPSPVALPREPPAVDPRVAAIESLLRRGTEDAGVCRRRVQPLLVDLAIHRLGRHRGVGLVEDPQHARRLLGDEAFHFLSDVVDEPTSAATIARTVDAIERL